MSEEKFKEAIKHIEGYAEEHLTMLQSIAVICAYVEELKKEVSGLEFKWAGMEESHTKIEMELYTLKAKIAAAPKVLMQRNTITGGIVCLGFEDASDRDQLEMDVFRVLPVDAVQEGEI